MKKGKLGDSFVNGLVDTIFLIAVLGDVLVGCVRYVISPLIGAVCALTKNRLGRMAGRCH
jgi:hypothetical protein